MIDSTESGDVFESRGELRRVIGTNDVVYFSHIQKAISNGIYDEHMPPEDRELKDAWTYALECLDAYEEACIAIVKLLHG